MRTQAILFAIAALLAIPAYAEDAGSPALGTSKALSKAAAEVEADLGTIFASNVYTKAQYGTGGVGLRNRSSGALNVSNVNKPTKAAFVYWAAITAGAPPAAVKSVKIQRIAPTASAVATVVGTAIGVTSSPCWSGDTTTVYKAAVPLSIANGIGTYQITLLAGASGSTTGGDPWYSTQKLPLMEGASLVVVGTGNANVSIFDKPLAGNMFYGNLTYTLGLPAAATGRNVTFDNIGADGQVGASRDADSVISGEVTTINGFQYAGLGGANNDSDWNGAIAGPLPQLWDTTGHQINAAAPAGTTSLNVSIDAPGDCLVPVANVVALY
ncbi:MAG: hypothetical protein IPK78_05330 [Rhodospirillales bacterium]|nr:hypothetical protein [Rhodospirillales bacterium]